jgi:hypothetical protein
MATVGSSYRNDGGSVIAATQLLTPRALFHAAAAWHSNGAKVVDGLAPGSGALADY